MTDVNANKVNANQVNSKQVNATSFGGRGGGGAIITANKIYLGGWLIEAVGDGIYVTTPGGLKTKMELIDFRQTPVPATPELKLPPTGPTVSTELPGGPSDPTYYP